MLFQVRLNNRWRTPTLLGTKEMSKAITVSKVGDDRKSPTRSFFCLRAWCIWRTNREPFLRGHPGRRNWRLADITTLKRDLLAYGAGATTTHDAVADELIRDWRPEIFGA